MKKNLLILLLSLVSVLCLCFGLAACDSENTDTGQDNYTQVVDGLSYTLNKSGQSYSLTGIVSAEATEIVIASECNGLPVTSIGIGAMAFPDCSLPTSITIPDSVTYIGDYAFMGWRGLTSIVIPDSVTYIGEGAFSYCSGLTSVTIGNGVTSIGLHAFANCIELTSITVANENTVYHSSGNCIIETSSKTLIAGCKNSVIPSDGSVTSIGNLAFNGCRELTSIIIPDSVTSIGRSAFLGCSRLTSITIPDSATSIGEYAFEGTGYYKDESNWENGVLYIGKHLIRTKATISGDYTINGGTLSIASYAFYGCQKLTSIIIPDSVTSIGEMAFAFCSNLTSIAIPVSVTSIGEHAFFHCGSLTSITFEGTKSQWYEIKKSSSWNYDTGNYTIHCTDGDINKN